jgi:hypothetical protein
MPALRDSPWAVFEADLAGMFVTRDADALLDLAHGRPNSECRWSRSWRPGSTAP